MLYSISGFILLSSLILSLLSAITSWQTLIIPASLFSWIAALLLLPYTTLARAKVSIILFAIGLALFGIAWISGFQIDLIRAFSINQIMLTLLMSVNYLKLVALPENEDKKSLPKGKISFITTFFGVHAFGSVINLSAILLAADRLFRHSSLKHIQYTMLTRAFATDALWSPFFVAFAAAIIYAPQASFTTILVGGSALVLIAFFITYYEFRNQMDDFVGYPISLQSLIVPVILALCVWLSHLIWPEIRVIVFVSAFSFILTLLFIPLRYQKESFIKKFITHTKTELPKLKTELTLFLAAGFFGASVSTLLEGFHLDFPVQTFTPFVASIILFIMVGISLVGIHPIISIAVIGGWLGPMELNQTLLAMTFLISWSLSICTSPVSGLNLALASRYNIAPMTIFKANYKYAIKLYFVSILILYGVDKISS
jgi:hypothetical protein